MAHLKAVFEGGSRFTVACRSHTITIDQPIEHAGDDAGMTPPELMAGSLASCIGFYVARYCQQANLDASALVVSCDWQVGGVPKHMERFEITIDLPSLPERRKKAIERVAQRCLIHATLCHQSEVDIVLKA